MDNRLSTDQTAFLTVPIAANILAPCRGLVATDPVQAGVMAVMAVADTAKFTVEKLKRRVF